MKFLLIAYVSDEADWVKMSEIKNTVIMISCAILVILSVITSAIARQGRAVKPYLPAPKEFVTTNDYKVLKGIKSVYILVETPTKNESSVGITESEMKDAAELSLRRNGIKVVPIDPFRSDSVPQLYVNVRSIDNSFSVFIFVSEPVWLERRPQTRVINAIV